MTWLVGTVVGDVDVGLIVGDVVSVDDVSSEWGVGEVVDDVVDADVGEVVRWLGRL